LLTEGIKTAVAIIENEWDLELARRDPSLSLPTVSLSLYFFLSPDPEKVKAFSTDNPELSKVPSFTPGKQSIA